MAGTASLAAHPSPGRVGPAPRADQHEDAGDVEEPRRSGSTGSHETDPALTGAGLAAGVLAGGLAARRLAR